MVEKEDLTSLVKHGLLEHEVSKLKKKKRNGWKRRSH